MYDTDQMAFVFKVKSMNLSSLYNNPEHRIYPLIPVPHVHVRLLTRSLAVTWVTDRTTCVRKTASDFQLRRESDFREVTTIPYTLC